MSHANITAIVGQIDSFPSLPLTVSKVLEITGNPESSANELMQAILPDQSMCAAILKIANSAFFGRPRKVSSIEEAVVVLGFDEVRNIILTQAIFSSFQKFKNTCKNDINTLWLHSLICGIAARTIARHTPDCIPNQLFIAGLLHDIGKLAMLLALPNSYNPNRSLAEHLQNSFFPEEEEKFGISHDQAGRRLLDRWLFPEQLCIATGCHHRPDTAAPAYTAFTLIVQMADILSHAVQNKDPITGAEIIQIISDFTPNTVVLWEQHKLHLQSEDLDEWLTELRTIVEDGSSLALFNP
jgi:HD-like signal output (HDOD) protein